MSSNQIKEKCRHGWFFDGIPACDRCTNLQSTIWQSIRQERRAQNTKWGDQSFNSDMVWSTVLMEEVGEAARASLQLNFEHGGSLQDLITEVTQSAAVAVAWLEKLIELRETDGI